jgi:hypothetical protein
VTNSHRLFIGTLVTTLACAQPAIEKAGGGTGGGGQETGGDGGGSGTGGAGGGGNKTDGPGFTANFGDGGAPDGAGQAIDPDSTSCAGEIHKGQMIPLDLMLLVDISGSMEEAAGMKSKWAAVRDALVAFVKDGKSAGLGVGLTTFPPPSKTCMRDGDCTATADSYCEEKGVCSNPAAVATTEVACNDMRPTMACTGELPCTKYGLCSVSGRRCTGMGTACPGGTPNDTCRPRPRFCIDGNDASCPVDLYEKPVVDIGDLPGAASSIEMALAGIVAQGTTPTTPAVQGSLTQLRARAMANPNRKQVLVLATDGLPTQCGFQNTVNTAAMAIRAGQMGMPSIPTYVIGVFGQNQILRSEPALRQFATAGGSGMPYVLTSDNDLTMNFLNALNQIRGNALGCEYMIPKPMGNMNLDYDRLNVRFTGPNGPEDLFYVGSADKCDPMRGGWYYDADPKVADPTRVLLCESTCNRVKMAAGSTVSVSVELRVGCKTIIK